MTDQRPSPPWRIARPAGPGAGGLRQRHRGTVGSRPDARGFALILVIWSLLILVGLGTGFAYAVRHETRVASDLAAQARAEAANAAALRYAVLALTADDADLRWQADGQLRTLQWDDSLIELRIQSESGRIDINRAPPQLLLGLFQQLLDNVEHAALVDALMDWRDRDDEPRANGAELDDYIKAGYSYGPTNRPFQSVHELSQVMGFDRDKVERLFSHLTIYGMLPRVHAASADATVLAAIPEVSAADAAAFVAYREQALAAGEQLDFEMLGQGRRYLDMRSNQRIFSIDIVTRLPDGLARRERTVVDIDVPRAITILSRDPLPIALEEGDEQL